MKRVICLIMIISGLGALSSCGGSQNEFTMTAEVRGIDEKIEVEVIRAEYATGPYLIITSDKTKFTDSDGGKITRADISVGDTIEIIYGGQVMMSYPPQIVAHEIVRKK